MNNEFIGVTEDYKIILDPSITAETKWLYHIKQNYFVKSGDRKMNDQIENLIKGYLALQNKFEYCLENSPL